MVYYVLINEEYIAMPLSSFVRGTAPSDGRLFLFFFFSFTFSGSSVALNNKKHLAARTSFSSWSLELNATKKINLFGLKLPRKILAATKNEEKH